MPVLVQVPVNAATSRDLPEELKARLSSRGPVDILTLEEQALNSERQQEKSARLREAHLISLKERAARESQRAEEASVRKRRQAEEEARRVLQKMEEAASKVDVKKQEQQEKRDAEKARRAALAAAALEARRAKTADVERKGVEERQRSERAADARTEKVAAVAKRSAVTDITATLLGS
jgi:hypothetical protein